MPLQIEKLSALLNILTFSSSLSDSRSGWCVFNEIQRDRLSNISIFKIFLKYFEFKYFRFSTFSQAWVILSLAGVF